LVGYFDDFGGLIVGMLFFGVLLNVPLPVGGVHAGRAAVGLLARMMTPHVLDYFGAPAASKVAPVAEKVARFLFGIGQRRRQ
jgi:hypothetical protein